ncbi:hypothetical protein R3P38DRAFT_2806597 [Favolaschia claudopus]|uniref:Protein kinase domain-containing protein n=1 Tax=Favolaschia claudopus TaxID=2862362 RepID=A0AAV9ZJQ2_9AGAR
MRKLAPLIQTIVRDQSYVYPQHKSTSVWSQMAASRVAGDPGAWINKLYASSIAGQRFHCYFKLVDEENMEISRWYNDADSLRNTVAIILYSLENFLPAGMGDRTGTADATLPLLFGRYPLILRALMWLSQTLSNIALFWTVPQVLSIDPQSTCILLTRGNLPYTLFDEYVGKGSCGIALRSRNGKKIIKFGLPAGILHEALIYEELMKHTHLSVPRYWGMYPLRAGSSEKLAIILEDVGSPIQIPDLDHKQRRELAMLIRKLHSIGVHHHDTFGNAMIDTDGRITLIDFDQAQLVVPGASCVGCDDEVCIGILESDDPYGESLTGRSACLANPD